MNLHLYAGIALAALLILVILAQILQFLLWIRVRYEAKAETLAWKGVVTGAESSAKTCTEAIGAFRESLARLEGSQTALALKQTALEESFSHFNAKTLARERELNKAAQRAAKADAAEAAPVLEDRSEALVAALAEQARITGNQAHSAGQANGRPAGRLIPTRRFR